MEGLGNRLSALHFFMSYSLVLPMVLAALKLLQSSMELTRIWSGMSSTSGVYPLFLLGDIRLLRYPNVDSIISEQMLCGSCL